MAWSGRCEIGPRLPFWAAGNGACVSLPVVGNPVHCSSCRMLCFQLCFPVAQVQDLLLLLRPSSQPGWRKSDACFEQQTLVGLRTGLQHAIGTALLQQLIGRLQIWTGRLLCS